MTLSKLEELIAQLNPQTREKFIRIFEISQVEGRLKIPKPMQNWVEEKFESMANVENQQIIKITNKITHRGILFNPLRSQRPNQAENHDATLSELIQTTKNGPFCHPEEMTPEDVFGRVRGAYCTTASNIAKADCWHGVIIFNKHDPLDWGENEIIDFLSTAKRWFELVHQSDKTARYPFIFWNCLWKASASIVHGHMQMTVSESAYAKTKLLSEQVEQYQRQYRSNYFNDLYEIHNALGLTLHTDSSDIKIMVSLCPKKERGLVILNNKFDRPLWEHFAKTMVAYRDKLRIKTFNVGITLPPLGNLQTNWNLPVMIEIIDRGDLSSNNPEIGGMEKFAQEVISRDPFRTRNLLTS